MFQVWASGKEGSMILISRKKLKLKEELAYWNGVVDGQRRVKDMLAEEDLASKRLLSIIEENKRNRAKRAA